MINLAEIADIDWSIEGKDIRLTVSCVGSDGNIKRSSKSSRRKERNENDRKHNSSSQEDIIAIFRRIQSSISKDEPIKYDAKNANDSDENSPAASILKVLGESGKKQGRARNEELSNNNTIYTRKRSVTKKDKGLQDFTQVAESKSKRPLSKFVKRSPIPYPTRPRGLSLELKNEMPLNIDGAEEELEPPRLERMKVAQLKEIAKSRGVKGYSKLKKSELINLLKS